MPEAPPNSRRGQRADGDVTRQRILQTAGKLFAERGYADTTSKAICEQANCNIAAVNYHFGSRDGLYREVLKHLHKYLISLDNLERLAHSGGAAEDRLALLIKALTLSVTHSEHWQTRLWARELLSPTPFLSELVDQEAMPKVRLVLALLSEITGIDTDDPALLRCLLSVIAPYLTILVVSRDIPSPLRTLHDQPAETLARHLQCFVLAGLKAVAEAYRRGEM